MRPFYGHASGPNHSPEADRVDPSDLLAEIAKLQKHANCADQVILGLHAWNKRLREALTEAEQFVEEYYESGEGLELLEGIRSALKDAGSTP